MFHVFTFHAAVYSDAMHVLYVHPNFPGQFGHIAMHLIKDKGWDCTFVTATAEGLAGAKQRGGRILLSIREQKENPAGRSCRGDG